MIQLSMSNNVEIQSKNISIIRNILQLILVGSLFLFTVYFIHAAGVQAAYLHGNLYCASDSTTMALLNIFQGSGFFLMLDCFFVLTSSFAMLYLLKNLSKYSLRLTLGYGVLLSLFSLCNLAANGLQYYQACR